MQNAHLTNRRHYKKSSGCANHLYTHIPMKRFAFFLLLATVPQAWPASSSQSESSFQLSPAPIPYPYFEPGVTDGKIDVSYLKLTFDNYSFNGLSIFGKGRQAFTSFLALDAMAGLMYLSGNMPGVGPISSLPAYSSTGSFLGYYTPVPAKTGTASIINMALSGNAELQVVHSPLFNAILFAGPSLNLSTFSLKTAYNKYYAPTGTTYTGYTDTLTTTIMLGGFQAGMQIDIPLGSMVRMSPFFVISSTSGSATITDDPGTQTSNAYASAYDIPTSTTTSLGFDIFINEISIGAMAQSGKSSQTGGNSSYLQLTIGYSFSNRASVAAATTEEAEPAPAAVSEEGAPGKSTPAKKKK